jgi:hypothetical protein
MVTLAPALTPPRLEDVAGRRFTMPVVVIVVGGLKKPVPKVMAVTVPPLLEADKRLPYWSTARPDPTTNGPELELIEYEVVE